MKHLFRTSLAPLTAIGLLLASPAVAQTPSQDPNHPPASASPGMMTPMMGMQGGHYGMMGQMMPMMPMMGMQGGHYGMMGMMHQHPDGYFAFLKTELGITEAQNGVWAAYEELLRPLIQQHQAAMPMMPASGAKPLGWIERLTAMEARMSEHLEGLKKIRPAATALYAALTPEQKQKADALMPGGMGMHMGGK